MYKKIFTAISVTGCMLVSTAHVSAGELIYRPINPSFGGDPLVGNYLLNKAQGQDTNKDPDMPDFGSFSETDLFLQDLRNTLVSDAITDAVEGEPGRTSLIESATLRVRVESLGGGGFRMNILDRRTGEQTTVNLGQTSAQF
ncbi:curli assembly protein CsgF [Halomonas sp. MA07-2]|uniref:curli assembly protein CsgF n=1 Tax=unclassified Halomonas TaxID=2609666 RepID=UPI003EEC8163